MSDESTQQWLTRNRPPRVKITYDVEVGDAIEKIELPLIVGILADLTGNSPAETPKKFKERKFVEIDADNFDQVMARIKPGVSVKVPDRMTGGTNDPDVAFSILFNSIEDFRPENIVRNCRVGDKEPLQDLLKKRQDLNDLLAKLDINEDLDGALSKYAAAQKKGAASSLPKEVADAQRQVDLARTKLEDTQRQLADQQKIAAAQKELDDANKQLAAVQKRSEAAKKIPEARRQLDAANIKLAGANTELAGAKTELAAVNTELAAANTELTAAKQGSDAEKVASAEAKVAGVKEKVGPAEAKVTAAKEKVTSFEAKVTEAKTSLADAEKQAGAGGNGV